VTSKIRQLLWLAGAAVPVYILTLLIITIAGRMTYRYDLEWMEGGLLLHAERISDGAGIYTPPSVEFIPYLYTPLYPGVVAAVGKVVGISYTLGRIISVLSLVGIAAVVWGTLRRTVTQPSANAMVVTAATATALGLFAIGYPLMEGWYDLVRADTLFLFMVTLGIFLAARWAKAAPTKMIGVAVLMALSFFCKQTGIMYVAWCGLVVLILNWRRAFVYGVVAGIVGLGGTWVLNTATGGWFWTYVFKMHQSHDFNMDRFWKSFEIILWHIPAATIVIVAALLLVAATAISRRRIPDAARPLLLWAPTYAVSCIVGAIGFGTEFAHYNAFMPAFLHGGMALAAALMALVGCLDQLLPPRKIATTATTLIALTAFAFIGRSLWNLRWQPARFTPTAADSAAGDALVAKIASIQGAVWVPFHPWYARMADKAAFTHRMGIKDVTWRQSRTVEGLPSSLSEHRFAAVIFDNRSAVNELPELRLYYRPQARLSKSLRPRVFTGANVVPESIWVPINNLPRSGSIFDFEITSWQDWHRSGPAWGNGPVTLPMAKQDIVYGFGGQRFASSFGSGDAATGRVQSPAFQINGNTIKVQLAGGTDTKLLRVEVKIGDEIIGVAGATEPPGEEMRVVSIDVAAWRGKQATIELIDDATGSWGHLSVDDVWQE
jgi:hypothetical protein